MSKRGRCKRGVASCSKKLTEDELHVEYDDDMKAIGKQKSMFASWLGLTMRARFPYHIPMKRFNKQMWENLWLEAKEYWNIQDDMAKDIFLKKAKLNCTNWRSRLYREYVKRNEEPFAKYSYLDPSKWQVFVASKNNPRFLEKSGKVRASALQNKDHHRMGRTGYRGLKDKFDGRWKQVSDSNSSAQKLKNQRSKMWVAGRASQNKQSANLDRQTLDESTGFRSYASSGPCIDIEIVNPEALSNSTSSSWGFQTSQQRHASDIKTSASVYKPEFVSAEVTEVQQQMQSTVLSDAANIVDSDDFVESLWAIPIVNQILRPQTKDSDQEKQVRKIKNALSAIKERPGWVQDVVSELEKHVGNYLQQPVPIEFSLPDGMYPYILKDFIEVEALLQVCANGWVDITIIHWFAAFLYTVSNDGQRDNPCAFFGPNSINGEMCRYKPEEVKGHILNVYELHKEKQYFLAPYLANNHWSLFIISPAKKEVFILDSAKGNKNKDHYILSKVIEDVFKGTKFTWTMVECIQQEGGWECGYMVLGFMMEFVFTYQNTFPTDIWQTKKVATQREIDQLLRILMTWFFLRMFPEWGYAFK